MDRNLREAERNPEPMPAQSLSLRLRAGELTIERVIAAASLGHEGAIAYLGNKPDKGVEEALKTLEFPELVAFAVDCAERVLHVYEERFTDKRPRGALEAARRWLKEPRSVSLDMHAEGAAWALAGSAIRRGGKATLAARAVEHATRSAQAADWMAKGISPLSSFHDCGRRASRAAAMACSASAEHGAEVTWQHARMAAYLLKDLLP